MQRQKIEFRDYIEALEQERLKIQVFSKELLLSLELVTQAIEACKQQLSGTTTEYNFHGQSECSEQTTLMEEGPVLEEFIPIKKRASPESCNDVVEDDEEQSSHKPKILKENHSNNNNNKNFDKRKSDWLRSVQLWKSEEKDGQGQRKQRRCWLPELHKCFLQALQQLGDAEEEREAQG